MPNDKEIDEFYFSAIHFLMEHSVREGPFKSIEKVEVISKEFKYTRFCFTLKKSVTVVKFVVNESILVAETLMNNLNIENFLNSICGKEYKWEIEYI
ncbi:gp107 [Bacillus phage G]|uniref:Gp107 n=1 Tax=Bacillus phage G TaxID=2884420 RepID=G3MBG9_9CAUD|nr:gp107 [Bacillus phage G]AEO93369.1 gp107 [Bacillus phage G]